ncbi:MAG TPA: phosphatase PAP2 family protein [Candidatus Paenibacillus intestinavium]|nr:phosphatase PAP2 family protein [Candidatus Paenibacillus intestinavium]
MKMWFNKWKHLLGILSIPFQGLIYMGIASNVGPDIIFNYSWIDTQIPFVKWFIFPYISWMPVLYLSFIYLAFKNRSLYWRTLLIYNVSVMTCNVVFWFFPTYVPRPDVVSTDLASTLVNFIYQSDAPLNCFPSVHCLTSYLLFITLKRDLVVRRSVRFFMYTLLWLIIISTVFTKQHALIDVFGGILFAEVTYRIVQLTSSLSQQREKQVTTSL